MSRKVCHRCGRAEKVCLCHFISKVRNDVEIGIIQHPTEVKQVKGTAVIAHLSLAQCRLWKAECLDDDPGIRPWLAGSKPVYLLYPQTEVQHPPVRQHDVSELSHTPLDGFKVLVLDGTWRKTYKILQRNPELQQLDRLSLLPQYSSSYIVRKQKHENALSTIEAIAELLSQLENDRAKFSPLLKTFELMQQQQMAFRKIEPL